MIQPLGILVLEFLLKHYEKLFDYELNLKQLMVKHKISSPEAKDPSKAAIN